MWDEALTKVSIPDQPDQHLMIFVPRAAADEGCAYGLGTIGAWPDLPGLTFVSDTNQSLVAHELGHNLGLHHSNALHCPTVQDAGFSRSAGWLGYRCKGEAYGDLLDVMGYSGAGFGEGSLNAAQIDHLGRLPETVHEISVADTGQHAIRIAPLSGVPTGTRVVKIVEPTGEAYYVEYRVNAGRDVAAGDNWLEPSLGVRVLRADPALTASGGGGAVVLDATPSLDPYDYTNNLAVGKVFVSAGRLLTVTVTEADSTGATIVVTNGLRVVPARAVLSGSAEQGRGPGRRHREGRAYRRRRPAGAGLGGDAAEAGARQWHVRQHPDGAHRLPGRGVFPIRQRRQRSLPRRDRRRHRRAAAGQQFRESDVAADRRDQPPEAGHLRGSAAHGQRHHFPGAVAGGVPAGPPGRRRLDEPGTGHGQRHRGARHGQALPPGQLPGALLPQGRPGGPVPRRLLRPLLGPGEVARPTIGGPASRKPSPKRGGGGQFP